MTNWTHRTIIVPAAFAPMARALAEAAGPAGSGAGMFQAMLSPTAGKPPTHYISAGLIWPEFAHILPTHDSEMWDAEQAALPESERVPITERPLDSAGALRSLPCVHLLLGKGCQTLGRATSR